MLDEDLEECLIAWIGVYGAVLTSFKDDMYYFKKTYAWGPKEQAIECLKRNANIPGECPEPKCMRKGIARPICVPRPPRTSDDFRPPTFNDVVRMNNTATGDLYESIGKLYFEEKVKGLRSNDAYVLLSRDSHIVLVPFRVGYVRPRRDIKRMASSYAQQLSNVLAKSAEIAEIASAGPGNPLRVVLCGHSEGGVTAQAMMYHLLTEGTVQRTDLELFLVTSGAHCWATPQERDVLISSLGDSHMACFVSGLRADMKRTGDEDAIFDTFVVIGPDRRFYTASRKTLEDAPKEPEEDDPEDILTFAPTVDPDGGVSVVPIVNVAAIRDDILRSTMIAENCVVKDEIDEKGSVSVFLELDPYWTPSLPPFFEPASPSEQNSMHDWDIYVRAIFQTLADSNNLIQPNKPIAGGRGGFGRGARGVSTTTAVVACALVTMASSIAAAM